jgi:DNA repair exonuclease SbcCD ATPase subunit
VFSNLIIENYQSHEKSVLEFGPGVNVIVGTSNSGKTAILQALNWPLRNRPLGSSFVRNGTEDASVLLSVKDVDGKLSSVRRSRSKKDNYYMLNTNGRESSFTSFGTDVPLEISQFLNITDLNIQEQLQPYFLVLDPPGQVAQYIRSISGLEEIDTVVSYIHQLIRKGTQNLDNIRSGLVTSLATYEKYEQIDLEAFKVDIETCKQLKEQYDALKQSRFDLTDCLQSYTDVTDLLSDIGAVDYKLGLEYVLLLEDLCETHSNLSFLRVSLNGLIEDLVKLSGVVGFPDISSYIKEADALDTNFNALTSLAGQLLESIEVVEIVDDDLKDLEPQEIALQKEHEELQNQLDRCPYCGQDLGTIAKKVLLRNNG